MIQVFSSPAALAEALADAVAAALTARLARADTAALAVSGGTTPIKFFQQLSTKSLDWARVSITLVDDRWVPESSARSNAALVKNHLLQGKAAAATFLPLVNGAATPEAGLAAAEQAIATLPLPFAAVVLGMGLDGHTASFFPGGDRLAEALAPSHGQRVESMRAEAAVEPRITLTLPVLLQADYVALHIEGDAKRALLQNGAAELPVRALLARNPAPAIFWSP
jgi:6-phosphogluconolactonase